MGVAKRRRSANPSKPGAWEAVIGPEGVHSAQAADRLAAAHEALKAEGTIQFSLQRAPPPPEPPAWLMAFFRWLDHALKPVGRFVDWVSSFMPDAPWARIFLWTLLGAAAILLIVLLYRGLGHGRWKLPRWRRRGDVEPVSNGEDENWAPEAAPARAWLREADSLAAAGDYAEAIHHLLFRSIEDMARRRPRLVRPALTSRELAAASAVPPSARSLFSRIAALVEESLFGGRPVGEPEWSAARGAYADFALPGSWHE